MKINIAASHRFHLLDLARELEALGHDVRFYSYVPTGRVLRYGLKRKSSFSLFYLMIPFLILNKISKRSVWSIRLINWALDNYLFIFMRPCDVFIALGTVYKKSFISAKVKFNAITILEWGSKHIKEQVKILNQFSNVSNYNLVFMERSLKGYNLADYISIPSQHVYESFVKHGISKKKIIQNTYGVDLSMFRATELSTLKRYDVIMVGGWRYEKGCDLLIDFFKISNLTFLHVGPLVNLDFPILNNMTHFDSVDQNLLVNYYAQARVFVLPSRAEGLAMVQVQALVCGLPIVCTKDTGGSDLREFLKDKKWIIEMQNFTIVDLDVAINKALALANNQTGLRSYAKDAIESFDWKAYALRYNKNLENICANVK